MSDLNRQVADAIGIPYDYGYGYVAVFEPFCEDDPTFGHLEDKRSIWPFRPKSDANHSLKAAELAGFAFSVGRDQGNKWFCSSIYLDTIHRADSPGVAICHAIIALAAKRTPEWKAPGAHKTWKAEK